MGVSCGQGEHAGQGGLAWAHRKVHLQAPHASGRGKYRPPWMP